MKIKTLNFNKKLVTAVFLLAGFLKSFAATIAASISAWQLQIKDALDAAAIVFAIVGGFIIFIQYMQGNSEAQKNFVKLCIGLGIFAVAELIVTVFIP